jgi:hypothetical protein
MKDAMNKGLAMSGEDWASKNEVIDRFVFRQAAGA